MQTKNCLKSSSAIKVAAMKNMDIFVMKGSHDMLLLNQCFAVSKDEQGTKEGTGKSMKNALYVCTTVCQKALK